MSAQPQRLVSALDLGSTKVVALIAEVTGDPRDVGARILGLGVERSPGIRRGVVRDIEETTRATSLVRTSSPVTETIPCELRPATCSPAMPQ